MRAVPAKDAHGQRSLSLSTKGGAGRDACTRTAAPGLPGDREAGTVPQAGLRELWLCPPREGPHGT